MNTNVKVTSTIFVGLLAVLLLGNSGRKSGYSVEYRRNHFFSSQDHKDIFIISAKGDNIFDALVSFRIISWQGNEIYCDTFSMNDLMERGPEDPRKLHDSLYILSTLSHFFDEDCFDRTYKSLQDVINEDYWGLSPEWKEFRDDTLAIGFTYQLGAEDGKSIAFSKTMRKVVIYYRCC